MFNANIRLNPWIQNLYNMRERPLRPAEAIQAISCLPGFDLRVLAMIPDLMRYPRENKERIQWVYSSILDRILQTKIYFNANKGKPSWNTDDGWVCNEQHGMFIAIGITLNAFLRVLNPSNMILATEQSIFCGDAIVLAERAKQERPLAAHHVPQAIVSAWCVIGDDKTKEKLRQLIEDYRSTYAMAKLVQHISYWQAAPIKLREIPWFRVQCTKGDVESGGAINMERGTGIINTEMQEYCCIL